MMIDTQTFQNRPTASAPAANMQDTLTDMMAEIAATAMDYYRQMAHAETSPCPERLRRDMEAVARRAHRIADAFHDQGHLSSTLIQDTTDPNPITI